MATNSITQERLKSLLTYDPDTGVFTNIAKRKFIPAGAAVGSTLTRGYKACMLDGKRYMLHRLAWLYVYGSWPKGQIDHINHITSDNRIANLRDVSCAENHQNRARKTKSASGYLGVTWHKRDKRWQAHIEKDGRAIYLGQFVELSDAVNARINAEPIYHPDRPNYAAA